MLNSSHFNNLNTAFLMKLLKSWKMYLLGIEKVKINVLNMSTRKTRNKVKKRKNKGSL